MKKIELLGVAFLLFTSFNSYAQWNWGDQEELAKEKNISYTNLYKAGNLQDALEPLTWLLENTPDLHVSIYQNGEKILMKLASKETDEARKEIYVTQGLELFDNRIAYFQKEAYVANRKAMFAYKFYSRKREKYPFLYELFSKTYELNNEKMPVSSLIAFMNVVYKLRFAKGDLSDEEVIEIYFNISNALDTQKEKVAEDKKASYDKYLDQVNGLLMATVEINCEFAETFLSPKLEATGDIKLAKSIYHLLLISECYDSPLVKRAAAMIEENKPD